MVYLTLEFSQITWFIYIFSPCLTSIFAFILGNELSGRTSIGASVDAELYGKDLINLKNIINELYKNSSSKPTILAPGGFFDQEWYAKFLQVSGSNVVNGVTHHIYNLGPGWFVC